MELVWSAKKKIAYRWIDFLQSTTPKLAGDIREPRPFHRTAEDGELLPKSDILESQLATSLEGRDESPNKRRNHAGMVPADRRTSQVRCARMNK